MTVVAVITFIVGGFVLSRVMGRNDVADMCWGLGFILMAIASAAGAEEISTRGWVILLATALWGIRLSLHLGYRVLTSAQEDKRYALWRKEWGEREPVLAFFKVFVLQGIVMGVIGVPIILGIRQGAAPLEISDAVGVAVFLIGFLFEAVADAQLSRFKRREENRGQICRVGLWNFSRHPNYFGEILIWWGIFLLALPVEGGWAAIISPLTVTILLTKVSGVPMTEKFMNEKGESFRRYVKSTPALIPRYPRAD